jgi:8-oxo-dGTP diphosphatase
MPRHITTITLGHVQDGKLLVVKKKHTLLYILPGGKPFGKEEELETLSRELQEELGCSVSEPVFEGEFTDEAAEMSGTIVTVRMYSGVFHGNPIPRAEITHLAWLDLAEPNLPLAPSITNQILPYLRKKHKINT